MRASFRCYPNTKLYNNLHLICSIIVGRFQSKSVDGIVLYSVIKVNVVRGTLINSRQLMNDLCLRLDLLPQSTVTSRITPSKIRSQSMSVCQWLISILHYHLNNVARIFVTFFSDKNITMSFGCTFLNA